MKIKFTVAMGLLAAWAGSISSATTAPIPQEVIINQIQRAKPRNVVFILSDDHRYDAMSFLGHPLAETPNMDRLAHEGAYFPNAMVTTSLCSPSRASIMTGLYTFRHRVADNGTPMDPSIPFFAQYLQQAGYATAFLGKWHMGSDGDEPQRGYDHWVSFPGQGVYYPPTPDYTLNVDGQRVPQKGYITDELTDYAVDWLEQQKPEEKPFFLYLSHKAVHAGFTPAPRDLGRFADRQWTRPALASPHGDWNQNQPRWLRDQRNSWHGIDFPYHTETDLDDLYKAYGETLCGVDDSIGRVMAQLERMGIADETLVIYMGDNGFMFGEHGLIDKRVAYEASIRVPLLMRCPAMFPGGAVIDEVVANIDIAPTIMEVMGLNAPPHFDGRSVVPLLEGQPTDWREQFLYVYYWERAFPQTPTTFALRGDRYKLITYHGIWDADELFDLQSDPAELHNLRYEPEYSKLAYEMETRLFKMMDDLGGTEIPLHPTPARRLRNYRDGDRGGRQAADFPDGLIAKESVGGDH
ncbi:sulfatase family protein [Synoicihabitans lomoniglobus]|uniref:Sulfatase n=1 Tax=Synoicihabitans lomoniglobus TaxID=2909285 RepID=A0AAF0CMK9_9BACT|nr:sulfatase [Opitutaceae bacterium LMO-M01]WED63185.1 sulfatase [Opitutaceae bacterium LMO-M01]